MAKDVYSGIRAVSARKPGGNKRKHGSDSDSLGAAASAGEVKDTTRTQLHDILSSLTSMERKGKHKMSEKEREAERDAKRVRNRPAEVSALELLMAGSERNDGWSANGGASVFKTKHKDAKTGMRANRLDSVGGGKRNAGTVDQRDKHLGKCENESKCTSQDERDVGMAAAKSTRSHMPSATGSPGPTDETSRSVSRSPTPTTPSRRMSADIDQPCSTTGAQIDVAVLVKTYRAQLRDLGSVVAALESELELMDRMWYKNALQFHSALWWRSFDGVRRWMHRLMRDRSSSLRNCAASADERQSLSRTVIHDLTRLYCELGGAQPTASVSSIANLAARPSAASVHAYLCSPCARVRLESTLQRLSQLHSVCTLLKHRCVTAAKLLLIHLNTPPAPTFAPLVTTLVALIANVHTQIDKLVASDARGRVNELLHLMHQLPQTART